MVRKTIGCGLLLAAAAALVAAPPPAGPPSAPALTGAPVRVAALILGLPVLFLPLLVVAVRPDPVRAGRGLLVAARR